MHFPCSAWNRRVWHRHSLTGQAPGGLHMRHIPGGRPARSILRRLVAGALPPLLTSCGGGYGGASSGGSMSCGGAYGNSCPPPAVTLTSPSAGTVSGKAVALTATATASSTYMLTIARVDFMVDGTVVGTKMASPYTVNWDSTTVANGSHTITAKATDSANGTATSSAVAVTVQNM